MMEIKKIPGQCVQSPQNVYAKPEDILNDSRLSEEQKMKALKTWEEDQQALLRADDENMPAQKPQNAPAPADMIERIQGAEKKLEDGAGR